MKKNKLQSDTSNSYWDEKSQVILLLNLFQKYDKISENKFWISVLNVVDGVFSKYNLYAYFSVYDDPEEEIIDAKSWVYNILYRNLFLNRTWNPARGSLFTFISMISKNYFIYYLTLRYKIKSIVDIVDFSDIVNTHFLNELDSNIILNTNTDISDTILNLYFHLITVFKEEPYKTIIETFFELLYNEKNEIYIKYKRNIYNYLHKPLKKDEKTHYNSAIHYVSRYLLKNKSKMWLKKYNIETFKKCKEQVKYVFDYIRWNEYENKTL